MKLSISIFILTTIIYGVQCVPVPDWVQDLQRDMQKMTQEMHTNQQQMDKTFKTLGQQFQNTQKNLQEQLKNVGKLSPDGTNGLQDLNGITTNIMSGSATVSTSHVINGHRVDKTVIENVVNNTRYRTEIEYDSATDETTTKKYECTLPPDSQCDLKSHEVKEGPPRNFKNY